MINYQSNLRLTINIFSGYIFEPISLAPRVHFNPDSSPSNHFALNTEILQPPVKPIFPHNGRFNAHTDVFNENGRFAKFSEPIALPIPAPFKGAGIPAPFF